MTKRETSRWLGVFLDDSVRMGAPLAPLLQHCEGSPFFGVSLGRLDEGGSFHDMPCPSCGSTLVAEDSNDWRKQDTGSSLRLSWDEEHMYQGADTPGVRMPHYFVQCHSGGCDFSKGFSSCYEELRKTHTPESFFDFFSTCPDYSYRRPLLRKFFGAWAGEDSTPVYSVSVAKALASLRSGLGAGAGQIVHLAAIQAYTPEDAASVVTSAEWKRVRLGANKLPPDFWESEANPIAHEAELRAKADEAKAKADDVAAKLEAYRRKLEAEA